MSAAAVTPEAVAKVRENIEFNNARSVQYLLHPDCTLYLLDALESAWRERDALRAEVERLRQWQAVEVPEIQVPDMKAIADSLTYEEMADDRTAERVWCERINAWFRERLSLPAPSADVVTVPRELLQDVEDALGHAEGLRPFGLGLLCQVREALRSAPPANEGRE